MINTTDRPIILHEGSTLDRNIRASLQWALDSMERRRIGTRGTESIGKPFDRMLGMANMKDRSLDGRFVQALFDYAQTSSQKTGIRKSERVISEYIGKDRVPAHKIEEVKRGIRLTLMRLWLMRAIALPTVFLPGSNLVKELCEHEIIRWLQSIDTQSSEGGQQAMEHRLHNYGHRIVLATNWERLEDVNLDDIQSLHLAQLNHKNGLHPYTISGSPLPFSQLPAALLATFPDRASFSNADLQASSAWLVRQRNPKRTAKGTPEPDSATSKQQALSKQTPSLPPAQSLSQDALQADTHEAVVSYVQRLRDRPRSADWRHGAPHYPGREHVQLDDISKRWIESFHAFLQQRKYGKGYRSDHSVISALNLLADYLFLYLPWWKELNPTGIVDVPKTPRSFVKYAFGNRYAEEPLSAFPMTFVSIVHKRRHSPDSAAMVIRHVALYFRFVGSYYGDDDHMAGSSFKAPLDEEFDTPRTIGKKNKTTKVVIPSNLYGHMLFYLYAVEDFGQHLLDQALRNRFDQRQAELRSAREFDPAKFEYTPMVRYRGQNIPLTTVPNVYSWDLRDVLSPGAQARLLIPHLTALRLLIIALETGLRCQSIQWLDITSWDSHNDGAANQYTFRLYVNTDKTRNEPWVVPVVYRVREVMTRESNFQGLFARPTDIEAVPYEGYEVSPFESVRPLFKSARASLPINDQHYSRVWISLQIAFEDFYKRTTGEVNVRLFTIKGVRGPDGELSMGYGPTGQPFCKLTTLAVHTPHACRATFATNRQGVLEIWDLIDLLGHRSVVSTSHYSKYSFDQLSARLAESDKATLGDFFVFEEGEDSAYVRPDKPDSALVRSFSKDRGRTIAAFGFMAGSSLWSTEQAGDAEGLELLKNGPMNRIRFRETHVCPVGEECPADVVKQMGMPKRCGMCTLAMKCIDHLPAIAAKKNQLIERIQFLTALKDRMQSTNEPMSSLDAVWEDLQLDVNEYLGWDASERGLHAARTHAMENPEDPMYFHADRPEIVRRHLTQVSRESSRTEFLLHRLAEANAYPTLMTPEVKFSATALRRRLSAGLKLEELKSDRDEPDDVRAVVSILRQISVADGLTLRELALSLERADLLSLDSSPRLDEMRSS